MSVFTLEEASQTLTTVLEKAEREGAVVIRRPDGKEFEVHPVESETSGLDVPAVSMGWTADEIVASQRETREHDRS